jgi:NTE family protein
VGDHPIESLPVRFTAVASDIDSEREVWFSSGSLFDAIRASIAIPGVFTPVQWQGRRLVDGGLLNPLPIAPTFATEPVCRIAVNLCGVNEPGLCLAPAAVTAPVAAPESGYRQRVSEFVTKLYAGLERVTVGNLNLQFYDIFNQSVDTMQGALSRMKLAAYPPDICLDVPRNLCRGYEFYLAQALIDYGYQLAERHLRVLLLAPAAISPPGSAPG